MRKMKTPEMDVVRFKESDVIVASGGVPNGVMRVNGYSNNKANDGTMSFGSEVFTTSQIFNSPSGFLNAVKNSFPGASEITGIIFKNDGGNYSPGDCAQHDNMIAIPINDMDGDYVLNNKYGEFTKTS